MWLFLSKIVVKLKKILSQENFKNKAYNPLGNIDIADIWWSYIKNCLW